jgi:hypothetical protein
MTRTTIHGIAGAAGLALGVLALAGCGGTAPASLPGDVPYIQPAQDHLAFNGVAHAGDSLPAQLVPVTNVGGGVLQLPTATVQYTGTVGGWLTAGVGGSSSPFTLSVQPTGISTFDPGTYAATVTLQSPGALNDGLVVVELVLE